MRSSASVLILCLAATCASATTPLPQPRPLPRFAGLTAPLPRANPLRLHPHLAALRPAPAPAKAETLQPKPPEPRRASAPTPEPSAPVATRDADPLPAEQPAPPSAPEPPHEAAAPAPQEPGRFSLARLRNYLWGDKAGRVASAPAASPPPPPEAAVPDIVASIPEHAESEVASPPADQPAEQPLPSPEPAPEAVVSVPEPPASAGPPVAAMPPADTAPAAPVEIERRGEDLALMIPAHPLPPASPAPPAASAALPMPMMLKIPTPKRRPRAAMPRLFDSVFRELTVQPHETDCSTLLESGVVIAERLPALGHGACRVPDAVRISAIVMPDRRKVELLPPAIMRCRMALSIINWVRGDVESAAQVFKSPIAGIREYDSYNCRHMSSSAYVLSEHGKANALDVHSFILANGENIELTDRHAQKAFRARLRVAACKRFKTVLGPGVPQHDDHIHLDLRQHPHPGSICHWDVRG